MNAPNIICVETDYGWGWSKDGAAVDTPDSFSFEVLEHDGDEIVIGLCRLAEHMFDGLYVVMLRRTLGPPATYTVLGHESRPTLEDMRKRGLVIAAKIAGYGRMRVQQ
jgi:hypothetical protein